MGRILQKIIEFPFTPHVVSLKHDLNDWQNFVGAVGWLVLITATVGIPVYYGVGSTKRISTYELDSSCQLVENGWVNAGSRTELQYNKDIITYLQDCKNGSEFGFVLWTVTSARVIRWASGATGLLLELNMGASKMYGTSIDYTLITCVNRFEANKAIDDVIFRPRSNYLESRDMFAVQGNATCLVTAHEMELDAISHIKSGHASGDFCTAIKARLPVICEGYPWNAAITLTISAISTILPVVNIFIRRNYAVNKTQLKSLLNERSGATNNNRDVVTAQIVGNESIQPIFPFASIPPPPPMSLELQQITS